jgi:hypothetical protein
MLDRGVLATNAQLVERARGDHRNLGARVIDWLLWYANGPDKRAPVAYEVLAFAMLLTELRRVGHVDH